MLRVGVVRISFESLGEFVKQRSNGKILSVIGGIPADAVIRRISVPDLLYHVIDVEFETNDEAFLGAVEGWPGNALYVVCPRTLRIRDDAGSVRLDDAPSASCEAVVEIKDGMPVIRIKDADAISHHD